MAFRARKTIKLFPGVKINLSKSGISTTVGIKGASVTHGHGKRRTNIGLPGSGLSHTSITSTKANSNQPAQGSNLIGWIIFISFIVLIFCLNIDKM